MGKYSDEDILPDDEIGLFPKISDDGEFARIEQIKNGEMNFIEWNVTTLENPPQIRKPSYEMKVRFSDGEIVAKRSEDPNYPGIDIEYYPDNGCGFPDARVLFEENEDEEKRILIWKDMETNEDYAEKFII